MNKTQFVEWFRSASPYIRAHRGRTFVVQVNDQALRGAALGALVQDLSLLASLGVKLVITFSTRAFVEEALAENKTESRRTGGARITDAAAMELIKQVTGGLLLDLQARFSMGLGNAPLAAAVRVNTGNYLLAKPLGVIDGVDYQLTGKTRSVDADAMRARLDDGDIIILPPLGYSLTGEAYNLSSVAAAADAAAALQADKLIYLVEEEDLAELMGDRQERQLNQGEAAALLTRVPEDAHARRYLEHVVEVCAAGVERTHLLNRAENGAVLNELFTRDGSGLMITTSAYDVSRRARVDDIGGILSLLEPLERRGVLVKRSREKLELEAERFIVLVRDGMIVGCAGLYPYLDEGVGELVCLVVHPEYHNSGRGAQLLEAVEKEARRRNIKRLFALTTQAQHWFLERGFAETSPQDLPVKRQSLYNYQRNARVLFKDLA